MKEVKGENRVTQSHELVEALRDATPLTLQESRIVLTAISTLQPTDSVFDSQRIAVQDLLRLFNITDKNHKIIEKACESLFGKGVKIRQPEGRWIGYPWFQKIDYIPKEGYVEFQFPNDLQRYLLELKKEEGFTSYRLEHILRLSSPYYQRIYEICFKWKNAGSCQYDLQHLKNLIGAIKKTYNSYGPFKQKVLIPAVLEINEKTNIKIDFEEIKEGRKVVAIKFFVNEKNPKPKPQKNESRMGFKPRKSVRKERAVPEWFIPGGQGASEALPEATMTQEELEKKREELIKKLAELEATPRTTIYDR